jgi:hypothetical protein
VRGHWPAGATLGEASRHSALALREIALRIASESTEQRQFACQGIMKVSALPGGAPGDPSHEIQAAQ